MSKMKTASDGLITEADIQQFMDEVGAGLFKDIVYDVMFQERELAIFVSLRCSKIFKSLLDSGIDGRRSAALRKHFLLTVWGAVILIHRTQRRQWEGFLPVQEVDPNGEGGCHEQ